MCLPGLLQAQSKPAGTAVYTIHIRQAAPPSRLDVYFPIAPGGLKPAAGAVSAASLGDWEVTVAYDAGLCEIYCEYRRKRDEFGRPQLGLWMPPIAAIQVDMGSGSKPDTVMVDPAGLRFPAAASHVALTHEEIYIPGRKLVSAGLVAEFGDRAPTSPRARSIASIHNPETVFPTTTPRRI